MGLGIAKYIKTKDRDIIIFPCTIDHSSFKGRQPISAGFVNFTYDDEECEMLATCFGESISLNLKSEDEDSQLATFQLMNNAY